MQLKSLGNRVLVKYNEEVEKTAGGLYIPNTASHHGNSIGYDQYSTLDNIILKSISA